jgi:predicted DNA-binding transcriptional regulator AlpA
VSATSLLTVDDVCAWLKVSRTKLHHMRKAGFPVPIRIGGAIRWQREDLNSWLAAKAVSP